MSFNPTSAVSTRTADAPLRPRLAGVFTDLVTPFRDDRVDEEAFVALVERQIESRHG